MNDDTIRTEVGIRISSLVRDTQRWQVYVDGGRVDLYGEPDSARTMCVLFGLIQDIPGVTGVRLFCGQAAAAGRATDRNRAERPAIPNTR